MKDVERVSENYKERLEEVLDLSWVVFKSRFIDKRNKIDKEAPFQHHFSRIISNIGEAYCTTVDDVFLLDLETKCSGIKDKNKYIDITCSFHKKVSCAIELKFKTAKQSAQNNGRHDAFIDIEALELACEADKGYSFGRFYMITNSPTYIKESLTGSGTVFPIHDGAEVGPKERLYKKDSTINLKNTYRFEWEKIDNWYFLQIDVN